MNKIIIHERKVGISRSKEFEKKLLANYCCNVGTLCGHGCGYCSTCTTARTQEVFKELGITSFEALREQIAIVDPATPLRVARDAKRLKVYDTVMVCSLTDAYSPEAQQYNLGRDILLAILNNSEARVRILTKNAAVANDFGLIEQHIDRIELSLSLTAPPSKAHLAEILEPNASPMADRIAALEEAKRRGISVYGMLCPCIPGIASDPQDFGELLDIILPLQPTYIWTEPVNSRGQGFINCENALAGEGYTNEAAAIRAIRNQNTHQQYVHDFIRTATAETARRGCLDRLKILIYEDGSSFVGDDSAVVWLK